MTRTTRIAQEPLPIDRIEVVIESIVIAVLPLEQHCNATPICDARALPTIQR
jgi:hypothetical protein